MPLESDRAKRIIVAVLANIDNWRDRVEEIAEAAIPVTGNKGRALALLRDMTFAKQSLCRLAAMEDEQLCDSPADDKPPDE